MNYKHVKSVVAYITLISYVIFLLKQAGVTVVGRETSNTIVEAGARRATNRSHFPGVRSEARTFAIAVLGAAAFRAIQGGGWLRRLGTSSLEETTIRW